MVWARPLRPIFLRRPSPPRTEYRSRPTVPTREANLSVFHPVHSKALRNILFFFPCQANRTPVSVGRRDLDVGTEQRLVLWVAAVLHENGAGSVCKCVAGTADQLDREAHGLDNLMT